MLFLFIVTFIFLLTKSRIKDRVSKLLIWPFFILWLGQGVLSKFGIFDNFIPKDTTLLLVSISMLFFWIGFRVYNINNSEIIKDPHHVDLQEKVENITNSKMFAVILLTCTIYVVFLFIKYMGAVLVAQSISDARAENHLQELYGPLYYYVNMLLLSPMSKIAIFLFAFKSFEKRDWMWLLMGLFLFLYKSLGGGRLGYLNIFIGIVFVGILFSFRTTPSKSSFKKLSRYLAIGFIAVGFYYLIGLVTAGREGDVSMNSESFIESQETTNKHFINYYVCPLVAFDYSVENNFVNRLGGYHYGALTLNSIEETFYVIFSKIGVSYKRPIGEYGHLIQENQIDVGSMSWNALYTWCNIFYLDFGVAGLVIYPFIIGFFVRKTIKYYYEKPNVFSASLLVWVYYLVIMSMVNYYFNGITSFITLLVLLYFSKNEDKRIEHHKMQNIYGIRKYTKN